MARSFKRIVRNVLSELIPKPLRRRISRWPLDWTNRTLSRRLTRPRTNDEGPVVLFASCMPGFSLGRNWISHVESLLAKHMEWTRGAQPVFFLDNQRYIDENVYKGFGFNRFHLADDFAGQDEADPIAENISLPRFSDMDVRSVNQLTIQGVPVGRLAIAGARYWSRKSHLESPEDRQLLVHHLNQAIQRLAVANRLLDAVRPDLVVTNHSTYADRGGVIFHKCLQRGIPVATWQARGLNSVIARSYSFDERMEHVSGLSVSEWQTLRDSASAATRIAAAKQFLAERMAGEHAALPRAPKIGLKHQSLASSDYTFSNGRPTVAVFTHLPWDASGSFYEDLFSSVRDWIAFTTSLAIENDKVNWVFRIHPAEAVRGSNEDTGRIIRDMLPPSARHIRVIPSDVAVSSYALANDIVAAVAVRGSLAVELPCFGIPVICAGSGHVTVARTCNFPSSVDEYGQALRNLPHVKPLTNQQIGDALLFAYGFFVQKPIPLQCVEDFSLLSDLRKVTIDTIVNDRGLRRFADQVMQGLSATHRWRAA